MISKELRKQLKLPITKDIVYYPNRFNDYTEMVEDIEIAEDYRRWYILKISTSEHKDVYIHSQYLQHMQKPSFIDDMKACEAKIVQDN